MLSSGYRSKKTETVRYVAGGGDGGIGMSAGHAGGGGDGGGDGDGGGGDGGNGERAYGIANLRTTSIGSDLDDDLDDDLGVISMMISACSRLCETDSPNTPPVTITTPLISSA